MVDISVESSCDIEVKQSKFLSFILPITLLDKRLEALKSQHPKARHFIVAWRKLNEFEQILEYSTDDGEPKGTSGRPVLNVLRGVELINSAVIIVRYFGGTKLGTGGLVRAYSDAAKKVLAEAKLQPFEIKYPFKISVDYSFNQKIEHWFQEQDIMIVESDFVNDGVVYHLSVTQKQKRSIESYAQSERIITIIKTL